MKPVNEPQPLSRYQDTLTLLAGETRLRVGVFIPTPASEDKLEAWRKVFPAESTVVVAVDQSLLTSGERVARRLLDVFVVPDLTLVSPWHIIHLDHYLRKGGALIVGSSDFLELDKPFAEQVSGDQPRFGEAEMLMRTSACLGIKPYVADQDPSVLRIDRRFLPSLPETIAPYTGRAGLYINNSRRAGNPAPRYGSVFSERTPDANVQVLARGSDESGSHLTSVAVLAQRWERGASLLAVAGAGPGSLLDPSSPVGAAFLRDGVRLVASPIRVTSVTSDYPVYREGETPEISFTITTSRRCRAEVRTTVADAQQQVWSRSEVVELLPDAPHRGRASIDCQALDGDVHTVTVSVGNEQGLLVEARNGFILWREEIARRGPTVSVDGPYLRINGRGQAVNGANYYESHLGETMWVLPNIADLADDFRKMEAAAINYIRIHYHHPAWFQDHFEALGEETPEPYRHIPRSAIAPEYYWRVLDAHLYLCQKHGIIYGGDLFTLVGEAMGDPRGWFGGLQDVVQSPAKRAVQTDFVAKLASRYRDLPAIAWDLWNEPTVPGEQLPLLLEWAADLRQTFRSHGDTHPITVGTFDPGRYDSVTDYYAGHGHAHRLAEVAANTAKPQIFQEVWIDRMPTPKGERDQCTDIMNALVNTYARGFAGFAPWQWTQQARLWNHFLVSQWEVWDDWLGACRRNDGTEKPAGRFFRRFSQLLAGLELREYDAAHGAIRTDRGLLEFQAPGDKRLSTMTLNGASGPEAGFGHGAVQIWNRIRVEADPGRLIWYHLGGSTAAPLLSLSIEGDAEVRISGAEILGIAAGADLKNQSEQAIPELSLRRSSGMTVFTHPGRLGEFWLRVSLRPMNP